MTEKTLEQKKADMISAGEMAQRLQHAEDTEKNTTDVLLEELNRTGTTSEFIAYIIGKNEVERSAALWKGLKYGIVIGAVAVYAISYIV